MWYCGKIFIANILFLLFAIIFIFRPFPVSPISHCIIPSLFLLFTPCKFSSRHLFLFTVLTIIVAVSNRVLFLGQVVCALRWIFVLFFLSICLWIIFLYISYLCHTKMLDIVTIKFIYWEPACLVSSYRSRLCKVKGVEWTYHSWWMFLISFMCIKHSISHLSNISPMFNVHHDRKWECILV